MDSIIELENKLYGKGKCTTYEQVKKLLAKKEASEKGTFKTTQNLDNLAKKANDDDSESEDEASEDPDEIIDSLKKTDDEEETEVKEKKIPSKKLKQGTKNDTKKNR